MNTVYRPINTTPASPAEGSQVVDIDMDEPMSFADDVAPTEQTQTAPKEEITTPAATTPVVTEQPKEQRVSRAQKRIKQLHGEKSNLEAELFKERQEKAELQKQLLQGHASTKESFKTTLEGQIRSLTSQLTGAMTSGDAAAAVAVQDQLINAKMELASLVKELNTSYAEVKRAESAGPNHPQQPQQNKVPERAMEWIEDHPAFRTDELFYNATIVVNNQLLREGFDAESDEFYAEIDKRLSKRFPEAFGISEQNSVQLSQNTTSNSSDSKQPDVKEQVAPAVQTAQTTKVRTVEQTVSGSSRPSANTIPTRKTTQVTLSAQDVKQAEAWGLSLEQMARRIAHSEANKGANGYVPINMKS